MAIVTFGYTSAGVGSFPSSSDKYTFGSVFTSGANAGTLNKITAFLRKFGTPTDKRVKAAIYNGTTLLGASTNEILQTDLTTSYAEYEFTFSGETILASTDYGLVLMLEGGDSFHYCSYARDDSGGSSIYYITAYGDFAGTATWIDAGPRKYSLYATYTEDGGGASAVPVIMNSYRQRRN
jgi:hypothetical protein